MKIVNYRKQIITLCNLFVSICLLALNSSSAVAERSQESFLTKPLSTQEQAVAPSITILLDDFNPQPFQGDSDYFYNRLNGDRGALNESIMDWGKGYAKATIGPGRTWGGFWESLNHPIREKSPVNFSALLPDQILPAYQSKITGLSVKISDSTPGERIRFELKYNGNLKWKGERTLNGGVQNFNFTLPALENINEFVLVLDNAATGDFVTVKKITFTATVPTRLLGDPSTAAFVWSYGMLLNNWNAQTGLVRDKAKDASGEFDAIQATGSLAAATALAEQVGIIRRTDAIAIISKIVNTLLNKVPRCHGLWPHFVDVTGGIIDIKEDTEYSSVDTVIAAIGLLDAQNAFGLNTSVTVQMLTDIDWADLATPNGISHGYDELCNTRLGSTWDTFGGESWLVELVYASATGQYSEQLPYPNPPTANGSGFIDELAWLFVQPPTAIDVWDNLWSEYLVDAAETQIAYFSNNYPDSCFNQLGLFGLSAAEVPDPSLVSKNQIYQPFGVRGSPPNDGSTLLGAPVVTPHYSAMIAAQYPTEATRMWDWLINNGYFSPLNNTESLMFKPPNSKCTSKAVFNDLKGSWNLALQTLGWGNYLVLKRGDIPAPWLATSQSDFLRNGYLVLVPGQVFKDSFKSAGSQDGWILESAEKSNKGGTINSAATTINLGDNAQKKQYRSILSFSTKGIPDNAVITKITLKVRKQGIGGGGNPVNTFQGFVVDIKKGFFGTAPGLQVSDFQATANKGYGPFKPALANGWYAINLTPAKAYINKLATGGGVTQVRLRFKLDDNNNAIANYLKLYSGNAPAASHPQLVIEYNVP
jgi:hypothetical protein